MSKKKNLAVNKKTRDKTYTTLLIPIPPSPCVEMQRTPHSTPNLGESDSSTFRSPATPTIRQLNVAQLPTPSTPYYETTPISPTSPVNLKLEKLGRNLQDELILPELMIPNDFKLELIGQIGVGSTSKVFDCKLSNYKIVKNVVVKVPLSLKKNNIMKREAMILHKLHSTTTTLNLNIVEFLGLYKNDEKLCILIGKMDLDLQTYLNSLPVIPDIAMGKPCFWKLFRCLMGSLSLMKDLNIVHCDLKTSNVLFNTHDQVFKICDFSSSKYHHETSLDIDTTLQFLAPELLEIPNKSNHNFATDLYSAGLILLHAATNNQPYKDYLNGSLFQLINLIKKNSVLQVLDANSVHILEANNDICEMLKKIVIQRCDLDEILADFNHQL